MKQFFRVLGIWSFVTLLVSPAFAKPSVPKPQGSSSEAKTMHWGADQSVVNRKTRIVELRGNAYLNRDFEELHADEIDLNLETSYVTARGRVRYQFGDYFVKADKVEVDLKKKTGTITNGNLSNGSFALRGGLIEQVGDNRYHVENFDYTTCLDCPNSWQMSGADADITIEGYAFIKDFVFKIKDASLAWLPYMILPIKSKRQSGLLFPRLGFNEPQGIYFVQPYYWATNDSSDMTFGLGYYSKRGVRFEWESRYALTDRSQGTLNFYVTQDDEIAGLKYRYAAKTAMTQELPLGIEAKLRVNEVSDSGYPIIYSEDILGRNEPVLSSDLFFSRNDPEISTVISFRRIRNLLYYNPGSGTPRSGFDPLTVQEFPRITINTNDQFLFGSKVAAGIETRFNRFSREGGPFDILNPAQPLNRTIRETNRFTIIPNLYTTLNPLPWLSFVPSAQYRALFYNFDDTYNNLGRGYLLTQAELSAQVEKVIRTDDPNVSYKHIIRPTITYSNIPVIQESSDHPFLKQVNDQAQPGQYFDTWDIVPFGTSQNLDTYFVPLGNSLTYSLLTQFFRKEKDASGATRVSKRFEARVSQTVDLREFKRYLESGQQDNNKVLLSPLFTQFWYGNDNLNLSTEYTYYSYLDRYQDVASKVTNRSPHRLSSSLYWNFESGVKDGVLLFDRSLSLNYTYSRITSQVSSLRTELHFSLNDYIIPMVSYTLDLFSNPQQVIDSRYGVIFQSPSRCWRVEAAISRSIDRGIAFTSSFAMNLTGNSIDDPLRK